MYVFSVIIVDFLSNDINIFEQFAKLNSIFGNMLDF